MAFHRLLCTSIQIPLVLVFFLSGICLGNTKRVLLLPYPFTSHIRQLVAIGDDLVDNGHEVYLSLTESYPDRHLFENGKVQILIHKAPATDLYMLSSEEIGQQMMNMIKKRDMVSTWRENDPAWENTVGNQLTDKEHFEKLKGLNFDLAIIDVFPMSRSLMILSYSLGVPYIGLCTQQEYWLTRTPALPSFVPSNMFTPVYTPAMNFWERLNNLWMSVDWASRPGVMYVEDAYVERYVRNKPSISMSGLASQLMLVMKDEDPLLDYPRPLMPHEITIGGLTAKPARQLPIDLEKFMDAAPHGVILMTFGSFSFAMDDHFVSELLNAFSVINYNIIWKYVGEPKGLSKNVKVVSWLPQNDILGHPKMKLFITHCGNNGQMEAMYQGVPMIGLPVFGDQMHNCKRLPYHGYGICLDLLKFKSSDLVNAVNDIMSNSSYTENVQQASVIFKDRPMKPREKALYWVEHVMKHGGQHLHSHALDMPWYEYLMLDIAAFVFGIVSILLICFIFLLCLVLKTIRTQAGHPSIKRD